jgi:2-keto-3-deoxy-L-arabinonate dehydratase
MTLTKPYAGVFAVAPTPFAENGDLDLEGQRRVLDCMIDRVSMASASWRIIPSSSS